MTMSRLYTGIIYGKMSSFSVKFRLRFAREPRLPMRQSRHGWVGTPINFIFDFVNPATSNDMLVRW